VTRVCDWAGSPLLQPGEYARHSNGQWFACTPNGHMANLSLHNVVEHEDGTITVEPSVAVSYPGGGTDSGISVKSPQGIQLWHGYLQAGAWKEVPTPPTREPK